MSFPSVSITDTWPGLVLCFSPSPLSPSDFFQADPPHHSVNIETVSKYLWVSGRYSLVKAELRPLC